MDPDTAKKWPDAELAAARREYEQAVLEPGMLGDDPLVAFAAWLSEAVERGLPEPNAMAVATAYPDARPTLRIVLLKRLDAGGFVFFTNYESTKGQQITANPFAALNFYWPQLERQVTVTGHVERLSREESDAYFASRPVGSQLGAAASDQSSVISDRDELIEQVEELRAEFGGGPIPRPSYWGGLRVVPDSVEFWQGRPDRLHDRLRYRLDSDGWVLERLSP